MVKVDMNSSAPQSVLRRVRRPVAPDFLEHAHAAVFRMLRGPRSRVWKYPGLMHRYATPDVERLLAASQDTSTYFISRKWSRCCLILTMLRDKAIAIIFHKENNRLEIVNCDGRLPQSAFQGTVIDGYLDISEGSAVFYVIDPVRYAGRWLNASTPMEERRRAVSDLYCGGGATVLAIRHLPSCSGVAAPRDADRIALVYARDRKGHYRAHALCFAPTGAPVTPGAAAMADDDDRYTVGSDDEEY